MAKTDQTEEALNAEHCQRELLAIALDNEIRREIGHIQTSLSKVAELFLRMRQERLWTYLIDARTRARFRRFDEYVASVTGDEIGHTKLYDLLAISRLSVGRNAVSAKTIQKLGRIKAAEIARLEPEQRTPELIEELIEHPVRVVKQRVQEIINKSLPVGERKEVPIFWGRYYPRQVIDRFERLEARGCFLEGIRDGDRTLTLRAKFMVALLANFEANFQEELAEADSYIAAREAANSELEESSSNHAHLSGVKEFEAVVNDRA